MADLYRDPFDGVAANFVGRVPAVGGAYDIDPTFSGVGTLANVSVDGAGKVTFDPDCYVAPRSAFTRVVGEYTIELKFTVDPLNTDSVIYVDGVNVSSDRPLVSLNPFYDSGTSQWVIAASFIDDDLGGSADIPDSIPFTPTGAEQTLTCTVTPGTGTAMALDGVEIYSTAFVTDINPDAIFLFANGTSSGGLNSLRLYEGPVAVEAPGDPITATLAATLEDTVLTATAAVIIAASLAITLDDARAGTGVTPPEARRPHLLLYEPLPLRTTRVLGDFAVDSVLAHVFGDLTASRFKLTRISDTRGHAADHAMEITGAGTGTTPTESWEAKIEDDGTGQVCTFVDFLSPVDAGVEMWAYGRGKLNPVTGGLIENPAEIMEAVSRIAYRTDRFQQAREECAGIRIAGRFAAGPAIGTTAATSIRASIDIPAMSAGLMWCAGMARRYPAPVSGYVIVLDWDKTSLRADLSAAVDDTADILRVAYDFCDVTGKPQKYIELTASPQRYGGLVRELALPMLRTPANAEAVCTPILQRLACERYDVALAIERTDIRPGQWLQLNLAKFVWPFSGDDPYLMVREVRINRSTGTTDAECEWMRTTPTVIVTAHSLALPDTFAGDVEIAASNGIATFTVYDDNHRGLQGARVSLDGGEPKTTDDRGQVSFAYVPGKTYQITIEARGRGTATIFQTLGS